jgi:8-oxo-dGTP diphosphatase
MKPQVGVGIIMHYPNWGIPWLLRKGTSHGNGEWSLPGGRLEYGELLIDCAFRELKEEFGIDDLTEMRRIDYISEDFFPDEAMHWITHYFYAKFKQMPKLMEPNKAEKLVFYGRTPEPTFVGAQRAIEWMSDNDAW